MPIRVDDLPAGSRSLARELDRLLGNQDGSLTETEADELVRAAARNPTVAQLLRDGFGRLPENGRGLLDALVAGPTTASALTPARIAGALGTIGATNVQAVVLGTDRDRPVAVHPDGYFTWSRDPEVDGDGVLSTPFTREGLTLRLYSGARVLARNPTLLGRLTPESRDAMVRHAAEAAALGRDIDSGALPSVQARKLRCGAAAVLVALAQQPRPTPGALASLLAMAEVETDRGLSTYLYTHLERMAGRLDESQSARLGAVRDRVLPPAPPYDSWFAGDNTTINVRHYVHEDYFDRWVSEYRRLDFRETRQGDVILFEKTLSDPSGVHPDTTFRVAVRKTEQRTFRDMDDPEVHIEWYSGHSNLGGNVEYALRHGPLAQKGEKWIIHWMCRGKQVLSDVTRRYPAAHYTTTTISPNGGNGQILIDAVFRGIAARGNYDAIRASIEASDYWNPKGTYLLPNDPRILQLVDYDGDGIADSAPAAFDPLHDASLFVPDEEKVDLKPRDNDLGADEVDGAKIMHGINFANTIVHYHNKESPHHPGIGKEYADRLVSGGWFEGPADEAVRVREVERDGETWYLVQVNVRLAEQTADAVGALMQYEIYRYAVERERGGPMTPNDRVRAALFAGEYLAYMYCSTEEADGILRHLGRRVGLPGLDWNKAYAAIDSDHSGYVTDGQAAQLRSLLGIEAPGRLEALAVALRADEPAFAGFRLTRVQADWLLEHLEAHALDEDAVTTFFAKLALFDRREPKGELDDLELRVLQRAFDAYVGYSANKQYYTFASFGGWGSADIDRWFDE